MGDLQILWCGVNYLDICKLEKEQLDTKYTDGLRKEMMEKMKRRQQQRESGSGNLSARGTTTHA